MEANGEMLEPFANRANKRETGAPASVQTQEDGKIYLQLESETGGASSFTFSGTLPGRLDFQKPEPPQREAASHAQIEAERGRFTMDDVVNGVAQKLVYRHPHVFGTVEVADSQEVLVNWEVLKRKEKSQATTADAIESVPHTLPALWRAEKIGSKTAKAGFDWASPLSAFGKLEEEVRELRTALEAGESMETPHGVREELGDLLFITAKLAQMTGVDPEDALHRACDKFDVRFRRAEAAADRPLTDYTEEELIALWKAAKEREGKS